VGSCEPRLWHVRGALPLRSARCRAAVLRYWQGVTGGKEASACFQRGSHELNTTVLLELAQVRHDRDKYVLDTLIVKRKGKV
jgi:hypothetical protein